ncbi:MAG TPA: hypothetical protein VJO33_06420 [Gemmatimonadaceae bacterium]|nr:hypothetical protein [Gemmatimonadaceae bacterium]
MDHVEVEEKTQSSVAEFQERKQFGFVDGMQLPNNFQFYDNGILHKLVHSVRDPNSNALVYDWQWHF